MDRGRLRLGRGSAAPLLGCADTLDVTMTTGIIYSERAEFDKVQNFISRAMCEVTCLKKMQNRAV